MAELDSGGGRNSNNNGRRMIKCYCNDDLQCPPSQQQQQQQPQSQQFQKSRSQSSQSQSQWSVSDASQYENLASFMSRRGGDKSPPRYCQTSTMCMTKRLQKQNGETWLKYSCDQSHPESIKGAIIEYRDCLVRTQSAADRDYVVKNSAEFCCNHEDFCNVDLAPNVAVKDLADFADNLNTPNHPSEYGGGSGASAHHHTPTPFFKPANLILSGLSFFVFLVVIVLFILYLYKKAKLKKDSVSDGESKLKPKLPAGGAHVKKPIYQAPGSVTGGSTVTTVVGTSSASCSPYSTTASSTTNTSIMPSKESSVNEAAPPSVLIAGPGNRLKMYEHNNAPLDEAFEPLLPLHQANTSLDDNTVIKLNSPLSSTSGGFNGTTTSSTTGGTSSTATSSTGTSTSNSTTHTSASQSEFEWSGSGSGAGVPQCVQRTIARQIKLIYPCIGKGRFGEVYKGVWRGELVAVKTFNSADERSWENECQIYQTQGFRHENILGFIAADNIDRGLYTELWLITEFHPNGSLFDYLTGNKIGTDTMLKMALSVVNGLVHLHMPIESCKGKPALAHCDLKSKNILVKADLTCCIGDLGLALSGDKEGRLIAPPSGQVRTGTKRYMAPEILSKEIDTRYLAPFQMAEIYSLALIFWELLRACRFEDEQSRGTWHELEYKLPYFEYLGAFDPDESMMRQLVCEQHLRPGMSPTWRNNALVRDFAALTEELWVDHPNERQNALRIKKSIMKINKTFSPNVNSSNNNNNTNINNINNNLNGPI